MSFGYHTKITVLVTLVGLLAGCGKGTVDSERDPVYFSPIEDQQIEPIVYEDPGPAMSAKEREQIAPVISGFRNNARQVLAKPDIDERISQIESVFIASGHIFELTQIYQDIVEEEGISSPAAPRLAWILMQLGQEKQARMWIDLLLVEYPGRASSWYLDAIYHLPQLQDSTSAAARVFYSWDRSFSEQTTELRGFGRQPEVVGREVKRLRETAPKEALDTVEAELAELLATPAHELPRPPALPEDAAESKEPAASDDDADATDAATSTARAPQENTAEPDTEPTPDQSQTPEPPPATRAEKQEPVQITVARGSIALSNDNTQKAMRAFQSALQRDPENVEAKLGMARAGWKVEEMRSQSATLIRELAARDDLTPRQKYDVGLFAYSKLDDNELAAELWTQVASEDPELAKRVGLEDLLEKVGR